MFEQRFPAKRAFVTVAVSGLGLEICEQLAANGWRLCIADINAALLAEVAEQLTSRAVRSSQRSWL